MGTTITVRWSRYHADASMSFTSTPLTMPLGLFRLDATNGALNTNNPEWGNKYVKIFAFFKILKCYLTQNENFYFFVAN